MTGRFKRNQKEARVHFIPNLKDRGFLTLITLEMIKGLKNKKKSLYLLIFRPA